MLYGSDICLKIIFNQTLLFFFQVRAEHKEKTDSGEFRKCLFVRQYSLPSGVDVEHVRPTLTKDGVLTIEAPAPTLQPNQRLIPIKDKAESQSA